MTIKGLSEKFKTVDLRTEVPVIIERTKADLILINQLQLFTKGQDSLGNTNAPYRSSSYAKKKESINPQPGYGVPDLKLTGEFYRDFTLSVKSKTFEVDSVNEKSAGLKAKYGDQIFGLNKESKAEYSTGVLFDGVRKYITSKTGLRFK